MNKPKENTVNSTLAKASKKVYIKKRKDLLVYI